MKTFRNFWRYLLKFFLEWEMFYTNVVEKIKTYHVQYRFSENCTDYEIIPKNVLETERLQMTSQYFAHALHAELARWRALMRMHTPTRPGTHMHARTHIQTNK